MIKSLAIMAQWMAIIVVATATGSGKIPTLLGAFIEMCSLVAILATAHSKEIRREWREWQQMTKSDKKS